MGVTGPKVSTRVKIKSKGRPNGFALRVPAKREPFAGRAYAAVSSGVTRLDASVGGLGGCPFAPGATGNIATEDLVYLLRDSDIDVDVDLQAAIAAAEVAKSLVGHDLPSALLRAGDRIQA